MTIDELRSTLGKMQVALDAIADAVVWTDAGGRLQWANVAFGRLVVRQPNELWGSDLTDLLPLDQSGQSVAPQEYPMNLALQSEAATNGFYEFRRAGKPLMLEIFAACVEPSEHDKSAVLVIRDITPRQHAEKALKDSQALYHSLVENIPLHVFRKDRESRFTFANQRFCESLGQPLEHILGRSDLDFYPEHLAAKYRHDDRVVLETGVIFEDVEQHQKPNGERLYVQVVKTPVFDAQKKIIGTQCMFWDVTASKWSEEQKAQLRMARDIQQHLLPRRAPRLANFEIGGACYPADATSGDYFDYIPLRDGSVGIVIADVSGHGFGPALIGAVTHACLRALVLTEPHIDIDSILSTANRLLYEDTKAEHFVTLVFAHLDPQRRSLRYASAGHPAGFLLDAAGEVKVRISSTAPPLGINPSGSFPIAAPLTLDFGDLVLLFSDGVQESMSPEQELFGKERALEIVRAHCDGSAQAIADSLCQAARAFNGIAPQRDDMTVVVIKVGPES